MLTDQYSLGGGGDGGSGSGSGSGDGVGSLAGSDDSELVVNVSVDEVSVTQAVVANSVVVENSVVVSVDIVVSLVVVVEVEYTTCVMAPEGLRAV